jgi:hypothetical protein
MADETVETGKTEGHREARETRDVSIPVIAKFAIGLLVGIAISMVLMMILYRFLGRRIPGVSPLPSYAIQREERLPPQPLQFTASGNRFKPEDFTDDPALQQELREQNLNFELLPPERYREVYDQAKQQELRSYGAMTKHPGEFHIPIDEAKRLLIERGVAALPAQPSGPAPAVQSSRLSSAFGEDSPPTAASAGRVPERRRD